MSLKLNSGARRIYEPKVTPYDAESRNNIYNALQVSCKECLDAVKYFESSRKYGYIWNIIDTTLMKFMYFAQPQGQLQNDMQKAIRDMEPRRISRYLKSLPREKLSLKNCKK